MILKIYRRAPAITPIFIAHKLINKNEKKNTETEFLLLLFLVVVIAEVKKKSPNKNNEFNE